MEIVTRIGVSSTETSTQMVVTPGAAVALNPARVEGSGHSSPAFSNWRKTLAELVTGSSHQLAWRSRGNGQLGEFGKSRAQRRGLGLINERRIDDGGHGHALADAYKRATTKPEGGSSIRRNCIKICNAARIKALASPLDGRARIAAVIAITFSSGALRRSVKGLRAAALIRTITASPTRKTACTRLALTQHRIAS